jgi:hypothetical protein
MLSGSVEPLFEVASCAVCWRFLPPLFSGTLISVRVERHAGAGRPIVTRLENISIGLIPLDPGAVRSSTILAVFNQFCYVPKHTVGEQLLHVREAKREQAAYESATLFESGDR